MKIFDFTGKKIKEIKNSNKRTFFIDTYYDLKLSKLFIITGNDNYVLSYDYNDDKIYYKYSENDKDIDEISPHDSIIMTDKDQIVKMIESSEDGNIRIWDFHRGLLLKKIFVSECKIYGICLWNNNFLFATCNDESLKVIDLKREAIINNMKEDTTLISIKTALHPIYGKCLVTQDWRNQIKLWANKF